MKYDVFISYSRKDWNIVKQFVNRLKLAGFNVWIDSQGIYSGDHFATNIVEAIENSKILLFFSSANSNASEWTVREIYYALSEHKTIIPIKIDTAKYDKRIALNLILVDFIQYQKNDFSSAAKRLVTSVAKHLGKPVVSAESSSSTTITPPTQPRMYSEELFLLGEKHYNNMKYEQAVKYYRKAAELGHTDAQYYLGVLYEEGRGIPKDYQQAVYWYRKAADQGDADAQFNLGFCYEKGLGVPKDYQQAKYWYHRAADLGLKEAIEALEHLNA